VCPRFASLRATGGSASYLGTSTGSVTIAPVGQSLGVRQRLTPEEHASSDEACEAFISSNQIASPSPSPSAPPHAARCTPHTIHKSAFSKLSQLQSKCIILREMSLWTPGRVEATPIGSRYATRRTRLCFSVQRSTPGDGLEGP
jgi:hypothetical protein